VDYLAVPQEARGKGRAEANLSDLASRDVLARLQEALARSLGVGLTVCDPDGTVVTQAIPDKSDLHGVVVSHRLFAAEVLMKAALQEDAEDGPFRVRVGAGASMLVQPVVAGETAVGAVIAGPFWSRRATPEQMSELLQTVGVASNGRVTATALSARKVEAVRDGLLTVSLLAGQLCEERLRAAHSISTLTTLNRIGQTVNSALGLEQVLEEVLDQALTLFGAESGSLMLKNEDADEMRILVARGLSKEIVAAARVKVGEGISGMVAREGQPKLLRRGVRERDTKLKRGAVMQCAMCVPLKVRDEVIGVLNVKGGESDDYSEQDLAVLSVMASHAANAIANAQLYDRAKRRATEMSALFSIGTAINSELERNQVLQTVLDHATELLNARKGSIMLLEDESDEMYIEVATGLPEEIISTVRLRLGEGIAGKVAMEGAPRLLLKGVEDENTRSAGREHQSALCVPLVVREHVIGVINVSDRHDKGNFTEDDLNLLVMLANEAAIAIENAKLHHDLQELFVSSITALANAIDARDPYTRGHSERVAVYSVRIGEHMGLAGNDLDFLRYAALLHDVGKINIKDEILNKPGRLTEDEFQMMKKHPEFGAAIMLPVKAFRKIIPFMFYHHEKYCAGGGYPQGLQGEEIPQEARIISVADSYDAMTSHRPYRRALSVNEAVAELIRFAGTQFDPKVVDVFLQILEEDPDFAQAGIEASRRSETEGWLQKTVDGAGFLTPGGNVLCPSPRPRVPSPTLRPSG